MDLTNDTKMKNVSLQVTPRDLIVDNNTKSSLLFPLSANLFITELMPIKMSRFWCRCANPLGLPSSRMFLSQVFNDRREDKVLSDDATLIDYVNSTLTKGCTIEYTSSSHCCKFSFTIIGNTAINWTLNSCFRPLFLPQLVL